MANPDCPVDTARKHNLNHLGHFGRTHGTLISPNPCCRAERLDQSPPKLAIHCRTTTSAYPMVSSSAQIVAPPGDLRASLGGQNRKDFTVANRKVGTAAQAAAGCHVGLFLVKTGRKSARSLTYLDTSVALAHLLVEVRQPPAPLWDETLVSSRLLECEIWIPLDRATTGSMPESGRPIHPTCRTVLKIPTFPEIAMPENRQNSVGSAWRRVRDLTQENHGLKHGGARSAAARCRSARKRLENPAIDCSAMDIWLREQKQAFAIETGQIEGLYLLRRGVTKTLIAEGFEGVRGTHSTTDIADGTLKGLLEDQEAALEMLFSHVKEKRPLNGSAIKEWHALLTRHQATAAGIDPFGNRVEIPLRRGQWKIQPNNPRGQDGFVHEYCPPEQVQGEIDRFLDFHISHAGLNLAPELEAAWLHHEFVRIHPFQDGNGRISRLLMALPFVRAGEFPPVIPAAGKPGYITALEAADEGNFPAFTTYLGDLAAQRSNEAATWAELILAGRTHYRHGNGGITSGGTYRPPLGKPERENPNSRRKPGDDDTSFDI